VWSGWDPHVRAVADSAEVSSTGEAWAKLDGRMTYRLHGMSVYTTELVYRDEFRIEHDRIGVDVGGGIVRVVVQHRCGFGVPESARETYRP
jgi:hypothetical protein